MSIELKDREPVIFHKPVCKTLLAKSEFTKLLNESCVF